MKPKSIGEKLNIVIESLEQVTRTGVYVDYILEVSLFTWSFTLKTIVFLFFDPVV